MPKCLPTGRGSTVFGLANGVCFSILTPLMSYVFTESTIAAKRIKVQREKSLRNFAESRTAVL